MSQFPKCPNAKCAHERSLVATHGFTEAVAALNGEKRRRFVCKRCDRTFTGNVYSLDYRCKNKDLGLNAKVFLSNTHGLSNRAIGRIQNVSEHCVRRRLQKMSEWSFDFQAWQLSKLDLQETLVMDGLQNFAGSQYDPNYINQVIGRDSLFIYDFNLTPLNRSGRMSPWQKSRLTEIEKDYGRYDRSGIRKSTAVLLARLYEKRTNKEKALELLSDEHPAYRRAITIDLKHCKIEHLTVSSKVCRNFQNILFSVNHADLLIRHQIGAFKRETISFSKTHSRMCQRFMLFTLFKNYMCAQFTKVHVRRPKAHMQSPAQALGLCDQVFSFSDIFSSKNRFASKGFADKHAEWRHFKHNTVPVECLRSKKYHRKSQLLQTASQ